MKYAIFSDVHANLDALERILDDAERCGAERLVCLGDCVGYGPLPAETLRRLRASASVALAGNHDDAVSGRLDDAPFIELASDAVSRHRDALSREDLAWLRSLPHTAAIEGAVLSHGDFTKPEAFRYIDSEDAARENFAATDATLAFVGHTHVPGLHLTGRSGRVYALGAEDFVIEDGKRYIVNVGSVGYPREAKGECYSSYVLYDSSERTVRFRKLAFSVSSVLQRGRTRGRRPRLLAFAAILLAVLVGAGAFLFGTASRNTPALPVPSAPGLPVPVAERTLELAAGARNVKANMRLEPNSPAATLTVRFEDGNGKELSSAVFTCKSSARKFKVPEGAAKAVFTLRPTAENAVPRVKEFAPAAE